MWIFTVVALANLVVGGLIGISGVSGFLLPIIFAGVLNLPVADSLTLSFASFVTYGVIGSFSYWKSGDIDKKYAALLAPSSLVGVFIGIWLSQLIPPSQAKLILYLVVLLSGVSLLVQRAKTKKEAAKRSPLLDQNWFVLVMGLLISCVCTIAGAGGPILMLPLLTCLGMDLRKAVGISMLDSVFIALPAFMGYIGHATLENILLLVGASVVCQAAGFLTGTRIARRIDAGTLKLIVALIAVGISLYTLWQVLPTFI